jgi:hypothetical protein
MIPIALLLLAVSYTNGVFVMPPDQHVTAGHHPLDLLGRTLSARRVDADRFDVTNAPLQYRDAGTLRGSFFRESNPPYVTYDINAFSFPFGTTTQRKLFISAFGGIYFSPPPAPPAKQHASAVSAVINPIPVIAPLLLPKVKEMDQAQIYVREQSDAVIVTWKYVSFQDGDPAGARYTGDVQAVLYANGNIDLNYRLFTRFLGGAPVITTGSEAFRTDRRPVASTLDPSGDASGIFDLRNVEVNRISDIDLFEIRATVSQSIPAGSAMNVRVVIIPRSGGVPAVTLFDITPGGNSVQYPNYSQSPYTGEVSGATVRILMPQEFLPSGAADVEVVTSEPDIDVFVDHDAATLTNVTFTPPARTLNMDVSALAPATISMPMVETFTVPALDPFAVWDALKSAYGFTDAEVDGVAIYTSFPTDIDFTAAAAYSTVGNPGADGIGVLSATNRPRMPALLHMNTAYVHGPLLHEFGHRWLVHISAKDGTSTVSLNDGGGHPKGNLDTTAAFTDGSSAMGGIRWLQKSDRVFQRGCGTFGYSWLDLYLMGLARPEEVQPIIDLGNAAYPGCGGSIDADKKTWTLQQIIAVHGPRVPAYAQSQKRFAMAWVLIEDPALTFAGASDAVRSYSDAFEEEFRAATGTRGTLVRAAPDTPPRRRAARH